MCGSMVRISEEKRRKKKTKEDRNHSWKI